MNVFCQRGRIFLLWRITSIKSLIYLLSEVQLSRYDEQDCHVLDILLFSPVVGPVKFSQLFLEFGVYFLI